MKFLTSKSFISHIERMTDTERSEILYELIYHAQWTNIIHPDRYMRWVIEEFITPFFEKKKKVSLIRSEIWKKWATSRYNRWADTLVEKNISSPEWTPEEIEKWFNEPEEIQKKYWLWKYWVEPTEDTRDDVSIETTISEDEPQKKFPERPDEYCPFPEPDISSLQKTPPNYTPNTPNFWEIFLTLDKQSLNDLPFSWHEIAWDIQERMTQIDRIKSPVVLNIKEKDKPSTTSE